MAKVRFKNSARVMRAIKQVFKDTAESKRMLNKIGEFTVDRNQFFARSGKSLANNKSPVKLPMLKETTKKIRKQLAFAFPNFIDATFFKADKSNVTFTGQLLKSLSFNIKRDSVALIFKGGRKKMMPDDASTNDEVYDNLEKLGFGFVGLDEKGQKRVKKLVLDEFRRTSKSSLIKHDKECIMQDDNEMSSGQPNETASGTEGETQQQSTSGSDSVKYDTYKKLLGEKKAADSRMKALEDKLNALEVDKMQAEGNKDELIQKLQADLSVTRDSLKQKDQAYAYATLGSQVKTEAAKMGCQDPDSLVKLMDLQGIPIDPETFRGDSDNIKMMLEEEKRSRPFYFGKPAPNIQDVKRQDAILQSSTPDEHDLSNKSREEIDAYIKKYGSQLS